MADYLVYLLVKGLLGLFRILPPAPAMRLGEALGRLFYILDKRHRLVALDNLAKVWGKEKKTSERESIARNCFVNLGRSLVEFCRIPYLRKENVDERFEVSGLEHFARAVESGRGVLAVTAHYGNWELMAIVISMLGYPSNIVVRPLDNPYLDKLLLSYRSSFGNRIIPKRNALKSVLSLLRKGGIVAMLMDQSTSRREAVPARFYGHLCYTLVTPALLALKTGCALMPVFMERLPGERHRIIFHPEMAPERSGDYEQDLLNNTQRLNDIIESHVSARPDHWLWIHRRWKF